MASLSRLKSADMWHCGGGGDESINWQVIDFLLLSPKLHGKDRRDKNTKTVFGQELSVPSTRFELSLVLCDLS